MACSGFDLPPFLLLWQTFVAAKLKRLLTRPGYNLHNKLWVEKLSIYKPKIRLFHRILHLWQGVYLVSLWMPTESAGPNT